MLSFLVPLATHYFLRTTSFSGRFALAGPFFLEPLRFDSGDINNRPSAVGAAGGAGHMRRNGSAALQAGGNRSLCQVNMTPALIASAARLAFLWYTTAHNVGTIAECSWSDKGIFSPSSIARTGAKLGR